ncbi:MAG: secretin N-terminal domain-containing protein, partial [Thiohalomonadales bacterium]
MIVQSRNKIKSYKSILLISLFLMSCASTEEQPDKNNFLSDVDVILSDSINDNKTLSNEKTSVDDITDALVPAINLNLPKLDSLNKEISDRFDIKVNRVNAKQFFMELVDGTNVNMVLHPDISGKISLDLKNVNVSDVMSVTRDVFGYDFVFSGNTYQIYPNIIRTRIFKVDYLNVNRKGDSQMRVSSGQVSQSNNRNNNNNSNNNFNNNSNSGNGGNSNNVRQNISSSRVATHYKSDFWEELEKTLKSLIIKKENRSVVVNAQSGIVVVRALTSELRMIEKYLKQTQLSIHRQVILETKILEVELNDAYQTGINWAALRE